MRKIAINSHMTLFVLLIMSTFFSFIFLTDMISLLLSNIIVVSLIWLLMHLLWSTILVSKPKLWHTVLGSRLRTVLLLWHILLCHHLTLQILHLICHYHLYIIWHALIHLLLRLLLLGHHATHLLHLRLIICPV